MNKKNNRPLKFIALKTSGIYDILAEVFLKYIKKAGLQNKLILHTVDDREGVWGTPYFASVALKKVRLVKQYLDRGYDVLLSDIDILFLKDPIPYLKKEIGGLDLLVQNNSYYRLNKKGEKTIKKHTINSGFMFVRSNDRTRALFDLTKNIKMRAMKKKYWWVKHIEDQCLLDYRLTEQNDLFKIKYKELSMDLFPVGHSIYNDLISLKNAYILHLTWSYLHEKIRIIDRYDQILKKLKF